VLQNEVLKNMRFLGAGSFCREKVGFVSCNWNLTFYSMLDPML
jgi:hypothetical protein